MEKLKSGYGISCAQAIERARREGFISGVVFGFSMGLVAATVMVIKLTM